MRINRTRLAALLAIGLLSGCTKEISAESSAAIKKEKGEPSVQVELKTNKGKITLELNHSAAPKTVDNFLSYVKSGHYNGTVFHRVIQGFMIQGGGFTPAMQQKPAPNTVNNEANNGT